MVPETARVKLSERIQMARRLGGEFIAEASGMADALCEFASTAHYYRHASEIAAYERGYRDASEIIEVETVLAARVTATESLIVKGS